MKLAVLSPNKPMAAPCLKCSLSSRQLKKQKFYDVNLCIKVGIIFYAAV